MINKFLEEMNEQHAPENAITNFNLDLDARPLPGLDREYLINIIKDRLLLCVHLDSDDTRSIFEIFTLDTDEDFRENIPYLVELSLSAGLFTIEDEMFLSGMELNGGKLYVKPNPIEFEN